MISEITNISINFFCPLMILMSTISSYVYSPKLSIMNVRRMGQIETTPTSPKVESYITTINK